MPRGENQHTKVSWPDRFWNKVNKNGPTVDPNLGPCWIWVGSKFRLGYGGVRPPRGKWRQAHVVSYELAGNKIQRGQEIRHKCNNRPCVNPRHLTVGTHLDNMHDAVRNGTAGYHKIGPEKAREIRQKYASGQSQKELSQEYNVHPSAISYVVNNKVWREEIICASI